MRSVQREARSHYRIVFPNLSGT